MHIPRFHLAFPVRDLEEARAFYGGLLGCPEGRSSPEWVDFDFYGHQIVAHLSPDAVGHNGTNPVDGHDVPVRHFGAILTLPQWETLAAKLRAAGVRFVIEPNIRYFVSNGAKGIFMQAAGNSTGAELSDLRNYVMANLLWDPSRSGRQLADEFLDLFTLGPHADFILRHFFLLPSQ